MSRHTPGPWVVESLVDGYDIHAPQAGCFIATTSDPKMIWGAVTRKVDAHLIAAAPDLLGALNSLLEYLREYDLDYPEAAPVFDNARAAIAKAKGS